MKEKKKKYKSTKHNKNNDLSYKTAYEEYLDHFVFEKKPVTDEYLTMLFKKFVEWAVNDPEAFKPSQFYIKEGIHHETWRKWYNRDPKYKNAYEFGLAAIGNRRELGALRRKLDVGIVSYTMSRYDPEWKELAEWRASLKNNAIQGNSIIHAVLSNIPKTDVVPEKEILFEESDEG